MSRWTSPGFHPRLGPQFLSEEEFERQMDELDERLTREEAESDAAAHAAWRRSIEEDNRIYDTGPTSKAELAQLEADKREDAHEEYETPDSYGHGSCPW